MGFPGVSHVKNICLQRRSVFDPWVGKILWRKEWQHIPVFLPEKVPRTEEPGGPQPWICRVRSGWKIGSHLALLKLGLWGVCTRYIRLPFAWSEKAFHDAYFRQGLLADLGCQFLSRSVRDIQKAIRSPRNSIPCHSSSSEVPRKFAFFFLLYSVFLCLFIVLYTGDLGFSKREEWVHSILAGI